MLKNTIYLHGKNIKTSILSALSLRGSFLMQVVFLFLSNAIFFSFWILYFSNFPSVKGWKIEEMACLYGIVSASYGLFTIFFGGARYLARIIFEGDLDTFLLRPANILVQILGIKSMPAGWGDIASSLLLITYSGLVNSHNLLLNLLLILSSTSIIISFSIITGSLAFWIGDSHCIGRQIFEFLLTFSNYPKSIYNIFTRFFLLTIIPSGFIGFLPVEMLKNPSLYKLFFILTFSSTYLFFSIKIFYTGLKRYSSSNLIGFRIS